MRRRKQADDRSGGGLVEAGPAAGRTRLDEALAKRNDGRDARRDQRLRETVGDQAVGVARIIRAVGEIVLEPQLLVREIAADQPVEAIAERIALEPQLLREGVEAVERAAVIVAKQDVEIVEVRVLPTGIFVVAIGGDRGQFGPAEILDDFTRGAPVVDVAVIIAARRDRGVAVERVVVDDRAQAALDKGDGRRSLGHRAAARDGIVRRQERRAAAFLAAPRHVADQPNRQIIARLEQQLPANQRATAVVDVAARNHVVKKAVAPHPDAVDAGGDIVGNRPGRADLDPTQVVIADVDLAADFGLEARLGGDDRNEAGRSVAAEQSALRSAQHLDPVERAELGQADAGARAIDAVDEDADRAFEAGVVADGADAADTGDARAGLGRGRGDEQRRGDLVELADIAGAGQFELLRGDRADGHRHVGQRLVAPSRGDDDVAGVDRLALSRLILDGGAFGCAFSRLGRALVGVGRGGRGGLAERWCGQSEQACRKQPSGFAHIRSPPRIRAIAPGGEG